jgi:hypothetical protein
MKKIQNPTTGAVEFQFNAKLVSPLGETTLQNSNGKNYKIVTIEFEDVNSNIQKTSAAIYEGNYSKGELKQGESYLATARVNDGKVYIQMSHLVAGAGFATTDMFDSFSESAAPANTVKTVVASTKELVS